MQIIELGKLGYNYRYDWGSKVKYDARDLVRFKNSIYVSLVNNNIGVLPSSDPNKWALWTQGVDLEKIDKLITDANTAISNANAATSQANQNIDDATNKANEALTKANNAINTMVDAALHSPYIDSDGYYCRYNSETKKYERTDVNLKAKSLDFSSLTNEQKQEIINQLNIESISDSEIEAILNS